jgi:hypothetical protein
MDWFSAGEYELAREVLQRGIAAIFVIAFLSTAAQFRALLGENGLLPVPDFVARSSGRSSPSLFRIAYSDRLLIAVTAVGSLVGLTVVVGIRSPDRRGCRSWRSS